MAKKRDDRLKLNLLSALFTCCILAIGVAVADENFVSRIQEISRNLDLKLENIFRDIVDIPYTDFDINGTYHSSTEYNPQGMGGLYNLTNMFMDLIFPKDFIPDDLEQIITVSEGGGSISINFEKLKENASSLALKFAGLIAILLILILMFVFFPLCGICVCCCRCCGNCGGRSQPFDKKNDLCKKVILASLLIVVGTLLLFCVVCAFVSNQQIQEGTDELPSNLKVSLNDADTYLKTTLQQVTILLTDNYKQFSEGIFTILDSTTDIVYEQLTELSNAVSMTSITQIVSNLTQITDNFVKLKEKTNLLRVEASQLNDALRKIKYDMLQTLNNCQGIKECNNLRDKYIANLSTTIDFNTLPNLQDESDSLNKVLTANFISQIQSGQNSLDEKKGDIDKAVKEKMGQVKKAIRDAGKQIENSVSNITEVIHNTQNNVIKESSVKIDEAKHYLTDYSPYRNYVGLAVSCVLLLVTICIALGLICGICGKRPDSYSDDCCNKGAGSRFLICGCGLMFLFAFVLVLVTIIYFVVGVPLQRVVCNSLREPETSSLMNMIDKFVVLETTGVDIKLSSVIQDCHKNQSIYTVLNLKNVFDLNKINNTWEEYNIGDSLAELQNNIQVHFTNIEFLSPEAEKGLDDLIAAKYSEIPFSRFTDELSNSFTSVTLIELKTHIDTLISHLQDKPEMSPIVSSLRETSLHLQVYERNLVLPMKEHAEELMRLAKESKELFEINGKDFEEGLIELKKNVTDAEIKLQNEGDRLLKEIVKKFTTRLATFVRGFLDRVIVNVQDNVGNCRPLSLVFNATLTATCDKIVQPINGFWFGMFWSLVLFIPAIIFSIKLATLYQKFDPYPGSTIEAEYLYDAYADRDNIPLSGVNNKYKKRSKKKNKRHDGRGAYTQETGDVRGDFPGGSHHQDARYADMAQKQWEDFPAGGPPQYQRAPTEYDRPPPYYYPGNGEQQ